MKDQIKLNKLQYLFSLFSAELKMDVLREREVKDSLERQLTEEQKLRGETRVQSNIYFNLPNYISSYNNTKNIYIIVVDVRRRHNFLLCFFYK